MASNGVGGHLGMIEECGQSNTQLTSALDSVNITPDPRDNTPNLHGAEILHDDVDDGDEVFLYPSASVDLIDPEVPQEHHPPSPVQLESPVFVYLGASVDHFEGVPEHVQLLRQRNPPSPAQLESLCAAASSGDLPLLKRLFRNALETGDVEPFGLANDASSRTGFTALHVAASRGYLDIVMWRRILLDLDKFML
ncbi:hypothetical protein L208DRAFT_1412956 [Tricholoma matsutake]|nr:hypothetical protein L208DRAFT_1412956 [Tricholoma matsutake 945]